ncbi:MAG TPA: type 2 isopentenyl-diphosphate Delta-isomerase [Candidatus Syntrophoarchaeum butanivorans]|uniref:Isopentenyl-diphosphate delta-isomerase n=1 Tax=Candidatus Syntropharchaeum butanivorans TaxID=1839936 RepID=A0A1F2P6F2_9EURY|nr:MAG: isopentenyl pyrophosphate isomerase [Candidatus Syntrophoarchaeum butanivorans]RJS71150.1 MAG: type 2 isopentenyl-diphosphate Delta-isomerase [Candidatus Syntrophoarchaeum sp. WYZ-LMO15]HDM36784.1 type 2 isopentenyl-diphosphate Delta-isomerase [Candidatus Syntrophoarchaeum butanivorans]HEC56643.1 type 2 isopentenyl-diphosphate Delta-isomerase [Candidatus Syntrophoarchaeum butanivorans]
MGLNATSKRKLDHLRLCAEEDVEHSVSCFEDVWLIHNALPEIDMNEISLKTRFLGRELEAPLLIASMTGGHPETIEVNRSLAEAAKRLGIGIGVGSQRAALEDPEQEESFRVVRDVAPDAFVYANIGAPQLAKYGIGGVKRAVEMIDADAVAIHLNFLQEAIQPEGDVNAIGCITAINRICTRLDVPVIVKETGAGISHKVGYMLAQAGVAAIDVGGAGGTSWAGIEVHRAKAEGNEMKEHLGRAFWNWGILTTVSIVECKDFGIPVIATGGVRSGIDIAKSIALGATVCGMALPLVEPALRGADAVIDRIRQVLEELKVAMFLTGSKTVEDLRFAEVVLTGLTREILQERGFETKFLR